MKKHEQLLDKHYDLISKSILFQGMTRTEILDAFKVLAATQKSFDKDALVFMAGGKTNRMGMILKGRATIESNDAWGNRSILSVVGPGEFFAETYALVSGSVLLVDVCANEETSILFFDMQRLDVLVSASSQGAASPAWVVTFLRNLLSVSVQKNLILAGRNFHTSSKKIRGRVMAFLNSVSLQHGSREFDIPFDRQQMADYLNLERTALSKELGRMKKEGLIDYNKNHFRILGD